MPIGDHKLELEKFETLLFARPSNRSQDHEITAPWGIKSRGSKEAQINKKNMAEHDTTAKLVSPEGLF